MLPVILISILVPVPGPSIPMLAALFPPRVAALAGPIVVAAVTVPFGTTLALVSVVVVVHDWKVSVTVNRSSMTG